MADSNDKTGRRKSARRLSAGEKELWQRVTQEAVPLHKPRRAPAADKTTTDIPPADPKPDAGAASRTRRAAKPVAVPPPQTQPVPAAPPLTGLDRRMTQRLGRGQLEVEATLDLHGHTQERAYTVLASFLTRARSRGYRLVLVITGKGDSPYARHTLHGNDFYNVPERPGILRAALPRWLEESRFRAIVAGFQPAHPRHGGGGAFYVRLRRKRDK
ncbi:DNA-nicking Smr family endonuclease [Parvibaculum indicum]|uniref:Smr/MutS family protein n=1 Tax=Parvibaculum indicum TaxID=562969 RepID=UPI00141F342A|nr:Smr/MutS family protein [Parvibaculum indicum]NIJ42255.1 DNA-nicking Smr family endonuclease [Parvibaculum indicum]